MTDKTLKLPTTADMQRDVQKLAAAFFAHNVDNILGKPDRLEAIATVAGIEAARVPAIRAWLEAELRSSGNTGPGAMN